MCRRPGTRMMAGAPYDLHCRPAASSLAGSQASVTFRASALVGILAASPFSGATMRQRQSSVTYATQYPVKSTGAPGFPGAGGAGGGPNCADSPHAAANIRIGNLYVMVQDSCKPPQQNGPP